jgi:hypothetical protein
MRIISRTILLLVFFVGAGCDFLGGEDNGESGGVEEYEDTYSYVEEDNYTSSADVEKPGADIATIRSVQFFGDKVGGKFLTYLAHVLGQSISGMPTHFVKNVEVENLTNEEQSLVLTAQLQGYSELGTKVITVPALSTESFHIDVSFDFSQLYSVTSPVAAVAEVRLQRKNGDLIDVESRTLQVQSKNAVFWEMENGDGEVADFRASVVTLVTPQDKDNAIEQLITEAGQLMTSGSMVGYQLGTEESVIEQAAALYEALKLRGTIYTHVPGSFFNGSQNVKLPAESLSTGSQNCVDGTLVFASAFEALGMRPLIIFKPGHAYVAVLLGPQSDYALFIETTVVSSKSAEEAMLLGQEEFEEFEEQTWLLVDVVAARSEGLLPMNL